CRARDRASRPGSRSSSPRASAAWVDYTDPGLVGPQLCLTARTEARRGAPNRYLGGMRIPGARGGFLLGSARAFTRDAPGFLLALARAHGPIAGFRLA